MNSNVLLERLGLSPAWVAKHFGATPQQEINTYLRDIDSRISAAVEQGREAIAQSPARTITLVRHISDEQLWQYQPEFRPLPASCHLAMLHRLRTYAQVVGKEIYICCMIPEDYAKWLGSHKDSSDLRAAWAALQVCEDRGTGGEGK